MVKKRIIISISGTATPELNNPVLESLLKLANWYYQFISEDKNINEAWNSYLKKFGELVNFTWDERPSRESVAEAAKRLEKIIEDNKNSEIVIFAGSLGAEIALSVNNLAKANRVVLVCPVNKRRIVNGIKMLEIYSSKDNYARLGKCFFWPFNFSQKMSGDNTSSINVSPLRHKDFSPITVGRYIEDFLTT